VDIEVLRQGGHLAYVYEFEYLEYTTYFMLPEPENAYLR
jgi:hypothetical protein